MFKARDNTAKYNCRLLFEHGKGVTFIIFDTETTGLNPANDRIIEFAAQKYTAKNGQMKKIGEIDLYIRPPFFMDKKVIDIHHITNEFLRDKQKEDTAVKEIQRFLGTRPVLLGYNVKFDLRMLEAMYERNGLELHAGAVLDVLDMARDITLNDDSVPDRKLGTIVSEYGLDAGIRFHNALGDVEATARVLRLAYDQYRSEDGDTDLMRLYPNFCKYWCGRKKEERGIWVWTNIPHPKEPQKHCAVFYSTYCKCWCSYTVDLSRYDIDRFEYDFLKKCGLTMSEFKNMKVKEMEELFA